MKVVLTTPHTGPWSFALGTGVVGVPLLTPKALANYSRRAALAPLHSFDASVQLTAQKDSTTNNPPLRFLIFKSYDYLVCFGPLFLVKKSRYAVGGDL